ncbi:hypothetical protein SNEBB_006223 [Seison nebaliae]|nr:hypothetical protein SNEBB_006223 [Seison nebaliae]
MFSISKKKIKANFNNILTVKSSKMSKTVSFNLTPHHHIIDSNLNFHNSEMSPNFETPKVPLTKIEPDVDRMLKLSDSKYLTFSQSHTNSDELEGSLSLYNSNPSSIVFKFKTTSPERYILKPVIGYLDVNQFCHIKFRIPAEYRHENLINNDRFQIIWKFACCSDRLKGRGEDLTEALNQRKYPTSQWNLNSTSGTMAKEIRLQCRVEKIGEVSEIENSPNKPMENDIKIAGVPVTEMENSKQLIKKEINDSVITPIGDNSTNWYKILFFILLPIVVFLIYVIFNIVEEE